MHVQHVVEELVLLVPERDSLAAEVVHRLSYVQEVLQELGGYVLVHLVLARQFERNGEHVQAEHPHPACSVALLKLTSRGEGRAPVKHSYIVQPQEASLEYVLPFRVLAVDPPCEVEEELVEDPLQE